MSLFGEGSSSSLVHLARTKTPSGHKYVVHTASALSLMSTFLPTNLPERAPLYPVWASNARTAVLQLGRREVGNPLMVVGYRHGSWYPGLSSVVLSSSLGLLLLSSAKWDGANCHAMGHHQPQVNHSLLQLPHAHGLALARLASDKRVITGSPLFRW